MSPPDHLAEAERHLDAFQDAAQPLRTTQTAGQRAATLSETIIHLAASVRCAINAVLAASREFERSRPAPQSAVELTSDEIEALERAVFLNPSSRDARELAREALRKLNARGVSKPYRHTCDTLPGAVCVACEAGVEAGKETK